MKGNYTKQDFAESLKKAIYESGIKRNEQSKIINRLTERGYDLGFISKVLEGNVLFDTLSLIDIGVFATEIYNEMKTPYINPLKYLEDVEMEKVKNHKVEIKKDILEYPVVFEDVRQVAHDMWSVIVPVQFIDKLGKSDMLNYEFETQREAKIIDTDQGILLTPTVNSESVIEISESIINNRFIPNTITLNIPLRNSDNFKYDSRLNRWILTQGRLNIIDGYHRYLGIITALRKKNVKYNFLLSLTNFDDDKAKRFIVQEDKKNPISKEYIKSIDDSNLITQILNQLNENNRSELKGKITTDKATIHSGYALVSFNIMSNTISNLWEPQTIDDADEIFDYLRQFFNKLVGLYPDNFKFRIQESKKFSSLNDERMFVIYLIIAKIIQNKENWRNLLENMLKDIDFEDERMIEYLSIAPHLFTNRFNRCFKLANEIVEVMTG